MEDQLLVIVGLSGGCSAPDRGNAGAWRPPARTGALVTALVRVVVTALRRGAPAWSGSGCGERLARRQSTARRPARRANQAAVCVSSRASPKKVNTPQLLPWSSPEDEVEGY